MEPEALDGAPSVAEEAMTIDYDLDPAAHPAEGGDAEMGEHPPSSPTKDLTDLTVLEADMVDDDALARHSSAGDAEIAIDEDSLTLPPSSSALDDVPFSTIDTAPIPVFSSGPSAPEASVALAEVDFTVAADPTLVEPEPALSSSALADAAAPPAEPAPPSDTAFSLGDGGAAVSALETLDEAEPARELTPPEPSTGAELAEELDLVPNGDEATTAEDPVETVIETAAREGETGEPGSQPEGDDAASPTDSYAAPAAPAPEHGGAESASSSSQLQGTSSRPLVNKDPLVDIEVPVRAPADPSSSSSRGVPAVFLSIGAPHGWTTYSLFHAERRDAADDEQDEDEHVKEDDVELLLSDTAQHALYYKPLDALFGALRAQLEFLGHDGDELVLEFDEIGLSITEDNVYTHQVTLHDFDRIHTGCQIPGRLHANLATQPRFSSGFNALAQHIALGSQDESVDDDGEGEEEGEGDQEPAEGEPLEGDEEDEGHDESGTLEGDDEELDEAQKGEGEPRPSGAEEGSGPEGEAGQEEEDGEVAEGPADDHDGPDSELVDSHSHEPEAERDGAEPVQDDEPAEDEFDLESALAELDGDDVVAVIEGAQEDLLLHGGDGEPDEALDVHEAAQDEVSVGPPLDDAGEPAEALEDAPSQAADVEQGAEVEGALDDAAGAGAAEVAADPHGPPDVDEPVSAPAATDDFSSSAPVVETNAPIEEQAAPQIDGAVAEAVELESSAPEAPNASPDLASAAQRSATAPVDEPEKPAGPADLVIDYDDAFDGSAGLTPSGDEPDVSLESKRSRDDDEPDAEGEETAADAKRPRLSDPVDATSS